MNFHGLNWITKKDCYLLPLIADLLDTPRKAHVYTKIDLRHAYHLVHIAKGDKPKTAFQTHYRSYEWCVMPFRLTNAPAAFQHFMNDIFADLLDICTVIYLDDILIYSNSMSDHILHVREALQCLWDNRLYASTEKCEFHSTSVEYLGFILSPDSLTMDPAKIQVIQDWPKPHKVQDIQSFLGFANFYQWFIYNYSNIVIPLTHLTREGNPWHFSNSCQNTFTAIKKAFTCAPVITHWVLDAQITVETDASDYTVAAILSITLSDGEIHPVAFYSWTLTTSELNYNTHDKELLATYEPFQTWWHYLEGSATPINVITNHKNLEYFSTTKILSRRQARWLELLSQFNLVICFCPRKLGAKPDALTRWWDIYPKGGDSDYATINPHNFHPVFTQEQLASSLRATIILSPVLQAVSLMDIKQLHSNIHSTLSTNPIASIHLKSKKFDPQWSLNSDGLLWRDNHIYILDSDDLQLRVFHYKHDYPTAGHFGQNKTINLVWCEYTWPRLCDFVKDFCKSCTNCYHAKTPCHRPYRSLKQLLILEKPWNSISMDFIEQLPASSSYTAILVIIDRLTKQSIFIPTHDTITSAQLAQLFVLHVFSEHGVPSHVTSDRGSEFVSHFFRSLGKALDMKLHFTSGYHPEGDGQTECTNQTLEQYLHVYCNYQQDNWADLLPLVEFAYNNALSTTTGISPFFANKGYHLNISIHPEHDPTSARAREFAVDLDELHQELWKQISATQHRYQLPADAKWSLALDFKVRDKVYLNAEILCTTCSSWKLSNKNVGLYKIIAKPGSHSFTLQLLDSMRAVHLVFHVSQLEPASSSSIPGQVPTLPPPVLIEGKPEFEISEILNSKVDRHCHLCKLLYLVCWSGYEGTNEETSWILASELGNASELIEEFHQAYPHKPGPLSNM